MLPKKIHIEQIERFHKMMSEINEKLDSGVEFDEKGRLALRYFKMDQLWREIDEFIEFGIKVELDIMENENHY